MKATKATSLWAVKNTLFIIDKKQKNMKFKYSTNIIEVEALEDTVIFKGSVNEVLLKSGVKLHFSQMPILFEALGIPDAQQHRYRYAIAKKKQIAPGLKITPYNLIRRAKVAGTPIIPSLRIDIAAQEAHLQRFISGMEESESYSSPSF
jgi:hypothetical protein